MFGASCTYTRRRLVPLGQNNAPREANKQAAAGGRRNSPNYTTSAVDKSTRVVSPDYCPSGLALDSRASAILSKLFALNQAKSLAFSRRGVFPLSQKRQRRARGGFNSINKEQWQGDVSSQTLPEAAAAQVLCRFSKFNVLLRCILRTRGFYS